MRALIVLSLLSLGCRAKDSSVDSAPPVDDSSSDLDGDGYAAPADCDDDNADVNPGASEVPYNGLDDDCDPETVDDDIDGDGFPAEQDCDDTDPSVHPDAVEVCNSVDDDCNGEIDDAAGGTWYNDADGDGYGDPGSATQACESGDGQVADSSDCDDTDPAVNVAADELCDGVDNDCDGSADGSDALDASTWYADVDADGFGAPGSDQRACEAPSGAVNNDDDCDDSDPSVNPDGVELCDGVDQDCDGSADEGAIDRSTWYADADSDGYGNASYTSVACEAPSGHVADDSDCDDADATSYPGGVEVCDDADNNCDGAVDEGLDTLWYRDADNDGFGDANSSRSDCAQPSGHVADATDCDDLDATAWPGATEVCEGADNDCDGAVDEGLTSTWTLDADGDGYGNDSAAVDACAAPSSAYVLPGGDCDDTDASYNPGATPGCDGQDYDCDGAVDNDADADGYADASCGGDDCDDSDANILPEQGGGCAVGTDCLDVLSSGRSVGSGAYSIDPDGYSTGAAPFEVYCDMSTDSGGWTQIMYLGTDGEGLSHDYASVFSSVVRGVAQSGSFKVDATELVLAAGELRYSDPGSALSDSYTDTWTYDFACGLTTEALGKITSPGFADQAPAAVSCSDLNTGALSTTATLLNYQGWSGCWTGPRLWVGSSASAGNYHGDYCPDCIVTWKCGNSTTGVYYGPAYTRNGSAAFWVR